MPVKVAEAGEFEPMFAHLKGNGCHERHPATQKPSGMEAMIQGIPGIESESTQVPMLEFPKGVIYSDQRLDLCKMVVGPPHIDRLLDSLDSNTFVHHFLLGNNIIGQRGARRIARFVDDHPAQMETWYLAGNCIDAASFHTLVTAFLKSAAITNIWLKRNPLTAAAADVVFELITKAPNLRTLDFDQTTMGAAGVAKLFSRLADDDKAVPLRNLYMNGNGIGPFAAPQIARYLASPHCELESLYMSVNPLGNASVEALARGIERNRSLLRLSLESVGASSDGANALFGALAKHPRIMSLRFGTAYQTDDLDGRFNYLTDEVASTLRDLITKSRTLRYLNLGYTAVSATAYHATLRAILSTAPNAVPRNATETTPSPPTRAGLLYFYMKPGSPDLETAGSYRRWIAGQSTMPSKW